VRGQECRRGGRLPQSLSVASRRHARATRCLFANYFGVMQQFGHYRRKSGHAEQTLETALLTHNRRCFARLPAQPAAQALNASLTEAAQRDVGTRTVVPSPLNRSLNAMPSRGSRNSPASLRLRSRSARAKCPRRSPRADRTHTARRGRWCRDRGSGRTPQARYRRNRLAIDDGRPDGQGFDSRRGERNLRFVPGDFQIPTRRGVMCVTSPPPPHAVFSGSCRGDMPRSSQMRSFYVAAIMPIGRPHSLNFIPILSHTARAPRARMFMGGHHARNVQVCTCSSGRLHAWW
jgi:hypothetical protein